MKTDLMRDNATDTWYTRPCGGRDVLTLALPLVVSMASVAVIHFIDRTFLIWYSTNAVAAALPSGMLHFTMLCFPLGVVGYVNTFVAQYEGARRPERVAPAMWQGVRIGLIVTPLFLLTIPLAPAVFIFAGHDPQIACLEVIYYQILAFGAGGSIISAALCTFWTGRGQTRVVMFVDMAAAAINIGLDYAWIFGRFGFPEMGIEGAAWATVVSQWFKVVAYAVLITRPVHRRTYRILSGREYDRALMWRLLRFGGPNGLQMLVEVAAFSVFILLVGRLGAHEMAATNLAFNVNTLAFVPMLGLGVAVTTMVGQQLGQDNPEMASRATWTSLRLALCYAGTMAVLYVAVPDLFLFGYASGADPRHFTELRELTIVLLRFVGAYCLFDAMMVVFVNAIKGAGDTRFILLTTLIMSPLPVLAGWAGIRYFDLGLIWCWTVITAWIVALGVIYFARFMQGKWQHMRVIESHWPPDEIDEPAEEVVALGG